MELRFEAYIYDEDTETPIAHIESYSQEGLEEEMGKTKWTGAVKRYEDSNVEIPDEDEEYDLLMESYLENGVETVGNMNQAEKD